MFTTKSVIVVLFVVTTTWTASGANKYPQHQGPSGRIIGGTPAQAKEFPYVAAFWTVTPIGKYFCGGAIINEQWVLTSGHCVRNATSIDLYFGSTHLYGSDENRLSAISQSVVLHPDFNPETLENDIGLIQFYPTLNFTDYIDVIELTSAPLPDNIPTIAVGWGQVNDDESGPVNDLQKVDVVTLTNEHCKMTYQDQITDNMVCVLGQYNEGTCIGDIGSPLILPGPDGPVHVGISSFISFNGCETIDPSGFTRTFPYVDWIKNITGNA